MTIKKIPIIKEDMLSKYNQADDGSFVDKDGKPIEEKDGKFYNSKGNVLKTNNPKKDAGPIERGSDGAKNKIGDLFSHISPSSKSKKTLDSSVNGSTEEKHGNGGDSASNPVKDEFHNEYTR